MAVYNVLPMKFANGQLLPQIEQMSFLTFQTIRLIRDVLSSCPLRKNTPWGCSDFKSEGMGIHNTIILDDMDTETQTLRPWKRGGHEITFPAWTLLHAVIYMNSIILRSARVKQNDYILYMLYIAGPRGRLSVSTLDFLCAIDSILSNIDDKKIWNQKIFFFDEKFYFEQKYSFDFRGNQKISSVKM